MRLIALTLTVLAAALAPAGCGGDDDQPVPVRPVERLGRPALERFVTVEEVRARLVSAADLYGLRSVGEARAQVDAARRAYAPLSGPVAIADPALDREVSAALDGVDRGMTAGERFDVVRDRAGLLRGQLLGGVLAELLTREAREDRGLQAAVLEAMAARLVDAYAAGATGRPSARESLHAAYGRLARCQVLARLASGALGPTRAQVFDTFSRVRERAFATGLMRPSLAPAREIVPSVEAVRRELRARFALR